MSNTSNQSTPANDTIPSELDAALDYARQGIPVFPCNPLDKKPMIATGFKGASADVQQVEEWWRKWPNAMIATPTGPRSGMWAFDSDVDPTKSTDGAKTLKWLLVQYGELPKTLTSITPRGGRHFIFAWTASLNIRNSASKVGPGLDVRGDGGYICLPPSRRADGVRYVWDPDGADKPALAPNWLVELIYSVSKRRRDQAWADTALNAECAAVANARPGTRNDALNTASFNLHQIVAGRHLDEQEVRDRLFEAAKACGLVADDGATSVWATIDSGAQAGKAKPRSGPAQPQSPPQPQATGAPAQPQPQPQPQPTIQIIPGDLPRVLVETERALLASGLPIFSRAGYLVRPVSELMPASHGRKTLAAKLQNFGTDSMLEPVAGAAIFQQFNLKRKRWVDIDPPLQIVRTILVREQAWSFPHCNGIITTPTLREDGSLLSAPGYDPDSQLYLLLGLQLPAIPENPTREEAEAALKELKDLLDEFSFREKDLDGSVALSGILTAQVRASLPTAPIHLIAANTPGTGKSHLVDTASMIASGRLCPVITASRSSEETEKRIGALLLSGIQMVSLDNVVHDLGGELLCQLSERPVIKIRMLGRSEMPECECRTAVFATGNNVAYRGDMVRRGLICTLEALTERPELRTFKHDVLARIATDRGRYVAAGLTIIRAYLAAGAPAVCGPFGSYATWSKMVRSPLVWLGERDPIESVEKIRREDPELNDIREFFAMWIDYDLGLDTDYTSARLIELACTPPAPNDYNPPSMKLLLLRLAGDKAGEISALRLGHWLRKISGRVVVGHRLVRGSDYGARAQFRLTKVSS